MDRVAMDVSCRECGGYVAQQFAKVCAACLDESGFGGGLLRAASPNKASIDGAVE